jgi:hypothetical protein
MKPKLEEHRFLDLLDHVSSDESEDDAAHDFHCQADLRDEEDDDDAEDLPAMAPWPHKRQESAHGPFHWNTRCSNELQKAIDMVCIQSVQELEFSVTIADPSLPDCPLVACSAGFTELTGYAVQDVVGRNCRFLLNGVPLDLIDNEVRMQCRSYCLAAFQGEDYRGGVSDKLSSGFQKPWPDLSAGEIMCVQTNARKSGELFRNMFYLKQVELDDNCYILGLQAGLPDGLEQKLSLDELAQRCKFTAASLSENMTAIEQILARQFWYSASMRRQVASWT